MTPYSTERLLEDRILAATPVELIQILFEEGLRSARQARYAMASGDVTVRGTAVSKCIEILGELLVSLDPDGGQETARRRRIYSSMHLELVEAHANCRAASFAYVESAFQSLLDNWKETLTLLRMGTPSTRDWDDIEEEEKLPVAPVDQFAYRAAGAGVAARIGWSA